MAQVGTPEPLRVLPPTKDFQSDPQPLESGVRKIIKESCLTLCPSPDSFPVGAVVFPHQLSPSSLAVCFLMICDGFVVLFVAARPIRGYPLRAPLRRPGFHLC